MPSFHHDFPFDPSYGYDLPALLAVEPPPPPGDFAAYWESRHRRTRSLTPPLELWREDWRHPEFEVYGIGFPSSGEVRIGGWLTLPRNAPVRRALIVGHGYGGREGPDFHLPVPECAFLFPCFRGLGRSRCAGLSADPGQHVLTGIEHRDRYVLGGCVEDLWLSVSALLGRFPECAGHLGYLGVSFGGGIGALALPWDERFQRAHLNVPTFGHMPLRLELRTFGSGEAVRAYQQRHGNVIDTLGYYDAAVAARFNRIPMHVAAALFDPFVAPPGQFAIYNALPPPKRLFVLDAGHFAYPGQAEQERRLLLELRDFFDPL